MVIEKYFWVLRGEVFDNRVEMCRKTCRNVHYGVTGAENFDSIQKPFKRVKEENFSLLDFDSISRINFISVFTSPLFSTDVVRLGVNTLEKQSLNRASYENIIIISCFMIVKKIKIIDRIFVELREPCRQGMKVIWIKHNSTLSSLFKSLFLPSFHRRRSSPRLSHAFLRHHYRSSRCVTRQQRGGGGAAILPSSKRRSSTTCSHALLLCN